MRKVTFRLGKRDVALEIPPFFLNFEKRNFSSMMTRRGSKDRRMLFYIYISRKNQLSKLLLLKGMHPSIYIPHSLKINEEIGRDEINGFIESVKEMEKEWEYVDSGLWKRRFNDCTLYVVLIIGVDRWTVRPMISREGLEGYGVEIPVDANKTEEFLEDLSEEEKRDMEIHEHIQNKHYHFTVSSVERFIDLAKKWDYYFSNREVWEQSIKIKY